MPLPIAALRAVRRTFALMVLAILAGTGIVTLLMLIGAIRSVEAQASLPNAVLVYPSAAAYVAGAPTGFYSSGSGGSLVTGLDKALVAAPSGSLITVPPAYTETITVAHQIVRNNIAIQYAFGAVTNVAASGIAGFQVGAVTGFSITGASIQTTTSFSSTYGINVASGAGDISITYCTFGGNGTYATGMQDVNVGQYGGGGAPVTGRVYLAHNKHLVTYQGDIVWNAAVVEEEYEHFDTLSGDAQWDATVYGAFANGATVSIQHSDGVALGRFGIEGDNSGVRWTDFGFNHFEFAHGAGTVVSWVESSASMIKDQIRGGSIHDNSGIGTDSISISGCYGYEIYAHDLTVENNSTTGGNCAAGFVYGGYGLRFVGNTATGIAKTLGSGFGFYPNSSISPTRRNKFEKNHCYDIELGCITANVGDTVAENEDSRSPDIFPGDSATTYASIVIGNDSGGAGLFPATVEGNVSNLTLPPPPLPPSSPVTPTCAGGTAIGSVTCLPTASSNQTYGQVSFTSAGTAAGPGNPVATLTLPSGSFTGGSCTVVWGYSNFTVAWSVVPVTSGGTMVVNLTAGMIPISSAPLSFFTFSYVCGQALLSATDTFTWGCFRLSGSASYSITQNPVVYKANTCNNQNAVRFGRQYLAGWSWYFNSAQSFDNTAINLADTGQTVGDNDPGGMPFSTLSFGNNRSLSGNGSAAVSALASPDISMPANPFVNGQQVTAAAVFAGVLPPAINPATNYYVVGATSNSIQLSLTLGGSAVTYSGGTLPLQITAVPVSSNTVTPFFPSAGGGGGTPVAAAAVTPSCAGGPASGSVPCYVSGSQTSGTVSFTTLGTAAAAPSVIITLTWPAGTLTGPCSVMWGYSNFTVTWGYVPNVTATTLEVDLTSGGPLPVSATPLSFNTLSYTCGAGAAPATVINSYNVSSLPTFTATGTLAVVTDAMAGGSCTAGGGSDVSLCRWSGSAWLTVGTTPVGGFLAEGSIGSLVTVPCSATAGVVTLCSAGITLRNGTMYAVVSFTAYSAPTPSTNAFTLTIPGGYLPSGYPLCSITSVSTNFAGVSMDSGSTPTSVGVTNVASGGLTGSAGYELVLQCPSN